MLKLRCVLCFIFLRKAPKGSAIVSSKLAEKYHRLPRISFAEVENMFFECKISILQIAVSITFLIMLLLWCLRENFIEPYFMPG